MFDLSDLDTFICPHRLPFDLSDQVVGAFGFICLCGHVGALEFMTLYSSVYVGAFRINYVFDCPCRRIGAYVLFVHVVHSGLCFYLFTST